MKSIITSVPTRSAVLLCVALLLFAAPSIRAQEDRTRQVPDSVRTLPQVPGREPATLLRTAGKEDGGAILPVQGTAVDERPMTFTPPPVPPEYIPPYYTNPSPMFRGDYSTGGPIVAWGENAIYGSGARYTLPGLGVQTEAGLAYVRQLNDRLYLQATANATKLSMMHLTRMAVDFGGRLTYQAQDHLWFNVFGGTAVGHFPNRPDWHYGGSVGFDLGERFSLELGVQRYYDPASGKWTTLPVVVPTVKFPKFELGLDVGPIIYEIIRRAVHGGDSFRAGPMIRPDVPGYAGGAWRR